MKSEQYQEIVSEIDKLRKDIHVKKSHDYATDEDVLSNFKRVSKAAEALNIHFHTSWGYALFMVLMKLDRLNNLMSHEKEPQNEGLLDTIIDEHNYIDLAYACYKEMQDFILSVTKAMDKNSLKELLEGINKNNLHGEIKL